MASCQSREKLIRLNRTLKANLRLITESIPKTPTCPFISGNVNLFDEQVDFWSLVSEMPEDYTLPRYGFFKTY